MQKGFTLAVFGPEDTSAALQRPFPKPPAITCDLEKMA